MAVIALFAGVGGEDEPTPNNVDSESGVVETTTANTKKLGDYEVEIKNVRLTTNYEGKPAIVVTYGFTNNSSESIAFSFAFEDEVYQDGVGLEKAYVLNDNDSYDEANQNKEIKTGVTIDVDVAYLLNDMETDIDVEVKELFSFTDDVIQRTFSIK